MYQEFKWTLVSERQPDVWDCYFVTIVREDGLHIMREKSFYDGEWRNIHEGKVIAWFPMPDVYEGEE